MGDKLSLLTSLTFFFPMNSADPQNDSIFVKLSESSVPIVGDVIEEARGIKNGNSTYAIGIIIKSRNYLGIYILDSEEAPEEALDSIIKEGTRIEFPKGNLEKTPQGIRELKETSFEDGRSLGTKFARRIKVYPYHNIRDSIP